MTKNQYAVYFHPIGYYAKDQKHQWEWQFTKNLSEAMIYKRLKSAEERAEHGLGLILKYTTTPQPHRKEIMSQAEHVEIKQIQIETVIKEIAVEKNYDLLSPGDDGEFPTTNKGWFTKPDDRIR
jgi:hypothetical protein